MERFLKDCANRPFRVLLVGLLLGLILAIAGSQLVSGFVSRSVAQDCMNWQLGVAGKLSEALPGQETAIRSAILSPDTPQAQARGEALLSDYAMTADSEMPEVFVFFGAVRQTIFRSGAFFSAALLLVFGLLCYGLLRRLLQDLRSASALCDRILENHADESAPDAHSADGALLLATISLLRQRIHHLLEQLQQEKQFLQRFMQDISHQLKTPLAVLKLNHDLLEAHPDLAMEKRAAFLSTDQEQLTHMEWLIAGQLKLARLDADAVIYRMEPDALFETCETAARQFRAAAAAREIALENNVPRTLMLLHDRAWLCEAIINLLKNALEHTQTGSVQIVSTETPMAVQLEILDTGAGIAQERLGRMFERFDHTNHAVNSSSTGIGLAIAKRIVEDHGGTICAMNRSGGGTVVSMLFLKKKISEIPQKALDKSDQS